MCGRSIQSAVAMGIHLRNEATRVSLASKEIRIRVFWSVYTLDILLSLRTGRPPNTNRAHITCPWPRPLDEAAIWNRRAYGTTKSLEKEAEATAQMQEQTNSTGEILARNNPEIGQCAISHFVAIVHLTVLAHEAIDSLYAPQSAKRSWPECEALVTSLNTKLDQWLYQLPLELRLQHGDIGHGSLGPPISLASIFYNIKLVVLQPCLWRSSGAPNDGRCQQFTNLCLESASQIVHLLPDFANEVWLSELSPWCHVLHWIMRSITVLLMALADFEGLDVEKRQAAVSTIRKAAYWLKVMSSRDTPSLRAWQLCAEIIRVHFPNLSADLIR